MDKDVEGHSSAHEDKKNAKRPVAEGDTLKFVRELGADLAKGEFDLPPFPDTALKVQRSVRDPNADNQSLADIIATEPALAARLMRMANSAMMRRGPIVVTDIPTAISRVGLQMVQNAATSFAARQAFKPPPGSPCIDELKKLRSTSINVAAISYLLAKHVDATRKPDEAMLAGLLSSVGKFYIYTKASDYPGLFTDRRELDRLVAQWHTGVARAIVESWQFPETVAVAIDEQEVREKDRTTTADLSDILFIANIIARAGVKVAELLGDLDSLARLGIDAQKLHAILVDGEEEIQSMVSAMA